jgi:formylglycine-generating enzyme required for sulfatase activity
MGSSLHVRETPPRLVFVAEFEIANMPVLVGQYQVFLDGGSMDERSWWSPQGWMWRTGKIQGWGRSDRSMPDDWANQESKPHYPVTGITWYEAESYCLWLGAQKNRRVRLPTEEEWEKSARGEDGRTWPWGDDFHATLTNTHEHGANGTLMAGSRAGDKSPYAVSDMAGNVQDWTSGACAPLPDEDLPATDLRIAKGGSWNDTAFGARSAFRHIYPPAYYFPFLGFRIVVERL